MENFKLIYRCVFYVFGQYLVILSTLPLSVSLLIENFSKIRYIDNISSITININLVMLFFCIMSYLLTKLVLSKNKNKVLWYISWLLDLVILLISIFSLVLINNNENSFNELNLTEIVDLRLTFLLIIVKNIIIHLYNNEFKFNLYKN